MTHYSTTTITSSNTITQRVTLLHDNYDSSLGWFYNQPDWHESVVKFPTSFSNSDIKMMMFDWLKDRLVDLDDAVWYDSGRHFKIKFKDKQASVDFDERWSYSWQPADTGLSHLLKLDKTITGLISIVESNVGEQGKDWEFCLTGLWFRRLPDLTKIQILWKRQHNHLIANHVVRPLSKSLMYETSDGRKIEMCYRYDATGLISTGFLGISGMNLKGIKDDPNCNQWCKEQYSPDTWCHNKPYIYFQHERDLALFILRWA